MQILDAYGNPIQREVMAATYNKGLFLGLGGWVSALGTFLNPDQVGVPQYQEMYSYDDAVYSGIRFVSLAALARMGEYTHADEKIQTFVRNDLKKVKRGFWINVDEMIDTGCTAGFSCAELIWDVGTKEIHLADIQWLNPAFLQFQLWTGGPLQNRVQYVKQWGSVLGFTNGVFPPIEKFLIFSHNSKYGNPYGNSRLKSAYPVSYFKKGMMSAWGLTGQMYGSPKSVLKVTRDAAPDLDIGLKDKINTFDYCNMVLSTLSNATGMTLPVGVDYSQVETHGDVGKFFENVLNYCDKSIYRAVLLPGLTASENSSKGGSRALGGTHFQMFDLAEDFIVRMIEDAILEQVVKRLIDWNFGPQDDYGSFQKDELDAETSLQISQMLHNAVQDGALDLQQIEDMSFYREKIGAPDVSNESWQSRVDARAAAMEAQQKNEGRDLAASINQKPTDPLNPKVPKNFPNTSPLLPKVPQALLNPPGPDKSLFSRLNGVDSFFVDMEEV